MFWKKKPESSSLTRIADALERIADSLERMEASNGQKYGEEDGYGDDAVLVAEGGVTPFTSNGVDSGDTAKLQAFLVSCGITVERVSKQEPDTSLDRIAEFMGDHYASIKDVLMHIKRNMGAGKPFRLSLKNASQKTLSDTTNLCKRLHDIALLTDRYYEPSPACVLYVTPSMMPKAQNFYSGQWLERFVKIKVILLLKRRSLNFSFLCNPQVTLPNGDDFELDMIFEAEGEVFWLEAKTGSYQQYIDKYKGIARILGLDRAHAYLILSDDAVTERNVESLSDSSKMTVVRVEKFAEVLADNLPRSSRKAA